MDLAALRKADLAHHIHPFTDPAALARAGGPRVIVRGEGVWLTDADGNRLLDGLAGLWCVALGYGRRELVDAAARQMREIPYYNSFFHTATPSTIELCEALRAQTPRGLDHFFFASSGSEANDTIVRMVWWYWQLEGKPEKRIVLSREHAYHGSTVIASSAGGMSAMHAQGGALAEFQHVMPPYGYKYGRGLSEPAFAERAASALEERIVAVGPERVAAFLAEPVQGAGGVIVPPLGYWARVQEICRRYDVLLVADEVITGFGRTGRWFGCETYGIEPDFMTIAKALTSGYLPLSAAVVGPRVARRIAESGGRFAHGFTYSGHATAAAVALETLRILREEGVVERVRDDVGPYLMRCLHEAFDAHPLVGEVRGVGLLAALELVDDKPSGRLFEPAGEVGAACLAHAFREKVVLRAVRDAICLCPPLVITRAEIDELVARARRAVDATARDLGRL
ncbi:MAG TPA: aminotransferase [Myxococcota bacterium]|jgi:putrescine aminotransferase|nr:aminotransferase [Myxococcota bacterium]